MKKYLLLATLFLSVFLLIFGCVAHTKLADYKPKSAEEKEVLDFMIECDEAYQNENFTKWLACFHDNANIRVFHDDEYTVMVVQKPGYKEYLDDGRADEMAVEIIDPKITITGDRATMKHRNTLWHSQQVEFDLLKEGERWSITRWYWTW